MREVDCVRAAWSKGVTCMVCLLIKQKCGAAWGKEKVVKGMVGSGGLPGFSKGTMKLLEWLVVGVERIGLELVWVNERLEGLEEVVGDTWMLR